MKRVVTLFVVGCLLLQGCMYEVDARRQVLQKRLGDYNSEREAYMVALQQFSASLNEGQRTMLQSAIDEIKNTGGPKEAFSRFEASLSVGQHVTAMQLLDRYNADEATVKQLNAEVQQWQADYATATKNSNLATTAAVGVGVLALVAGAVALGFAADKAARKRTAPSGQVLYTQTGSITSCQQY